MTRDRAMCTSGPRAPDESSNPLHLIMLEELLSKWNIYKALASPPQFPIKLWGHETRVVYIESSWGPEVPYPSFEREDGSRNHGLVSLKSNPEAASHIPEVQDWPELRRFLEVINAPASPIESLGCEKAYFPDESANATVKIASYVDVAFSLAPLNQEPENLLRLAAVLIQSVDGCEQWWGSVELALQRLRYFQAVPSPWGLMIRTGNHGRSEGEARRYWGETLSRLGDAVRSLPPRFLA
jgi:hypothetical protein